MKIVDANVLLYAVNADSIQHAPTLQWLEHALGGHDTVGLTWSAMLAFLRLSTHASVFAQPLTAEEATTQLTAWASAPGALVVHPGASHLGLLSGLLAHVGSAANLANDAHLAAIALEQRAVIVSYDGDFARFPGVTARTPLELLG